MGTVQPAGDLMTKRNVLGAANFLNPGRIAESTYNSGDEELRAVGVLAGVGHGEKTRLGVLELHQDNTPPSET